MPDVASADDVARVFRVESGRVVAHLVRRFGDISLAEEAVQDAFVRAAERWPVDGVPPNPGGWITTVARNRALDIVRRESTRAERYRRAFHLDAVNRGTAGPGQNIMHDHDPDELGTTAAIGDDRLRLVFTCCHPALAPDVRVAMTLRLLGGLQTDEIARAFLVPEATMAQRLVRAKRKIQATNIPYRVPAGAELPERLAGVLAVVYLVFNEGYLASRGESLVRDDLCAEAIRLGRVMAELMPDEPEVIGLLGLMLLTAARRPARTDDSGRPVVLADQDRTRWDRELIRTGHDLVRQCLRRDRPGPYQIQAAIAAVHADAPTADATDWHQIVTLYDLLLAMHPHDVVRLNRAIAVAERDGAEQGLAEIEPLPLDHYQPWHTARAELLRRCGRDDEAIDAYAAAIERTRNDAELAFLQRRRDALLTAG